MHLTLEYCSLRGAMTALTNTWHIVGLLAMPWGNTFHSYLLSGSSWLQEGMVNANRSLSLMQRGIEKKQSFISITMTGQWLGKADNKGRPRCTGPITCICWLIARRSWSSLHFPVFFFITKMGVFQGDTEVWMCPRESCSLTKEWAAASFSEERGHWGTHTGSSVFHVMGIPSSMAPRKNPDLANRVFVEQQLG